MRELAAKVKRFFSRRQHPVKLVSYTSKNLWLLLIPLTKRLIGSQFNFKEWILINWIDILSISVIFAIALLRWIFISFRIESDGLVANTGLFGMVHTKVYYSQITTVSFCQSWYGRPFGAHTIYVETNAKTVTKEDVRLVISRKNAHKLYGYVSRVSDGKPRATYSPRKLHLLLFSVLFSSAFTGMLLYGTFMFETNRLVGTEMEQKMVAKVNGEISKIDSRTLNLAKTIPRVILVMAGIVIGGWLISFIATLARHWSFTVSRTDRQLLVKSGVLIKRRHVINRSRVNYYDITQTLLMKIFKICSVTLDCTGYGKSRREISALIPITTYDRMNASLELLVPELPRAKPELCTGSANDVRRFVTGPVLLCLIPTVTIQLLNKYFPSHNTDINALLAILTVPMIWLVIVKTASAFGTSVGFDETGCVLNYCKWYRFHKVLLPKENITMIRITRNPFQLLNNTCMLRVYTTGEKRKPHRINYICYSKLREICVREGYQMYK